MTGTMQTGSRQKALTFVQDELCLWQQEHRADEVHDHNDNICLQCSQSLATAGLSEHLGSSGGVKLSEHTVGVGDRLGLKADQHIE